MIDATSQRSKNICIVEDEQQQHSVEEMPRSVASDTEGIVFIDDNRPNFEFKKQQDIEPAMQDYENWKQDDFYEDNDLSEEYKSVKGDYVDVQLKNTFSKMSQPLEHSRP
jgi:hypothetical protein